MVYDFTNEQGKFICPACGLAGAKKKPAPGQGGAGNGRTAQATRRGRALTLEEYLQIPTFLRQGKRVTS